VLRPWNPEGENMTPTPASAYEYAPQMSQDDFAREVEQLIANKRAERNNHIEDISHLNSKIRLLDLQINAFEYAIGKTQTLTIPAHLIRGE
jgi:hypothetical protein